MKVWASDYNNILTLTIEELKKRNWFEENPRKADVFLLWQDVRGELKNLAEIAVESLNKPVLVVQHGRGATRDYNFPNNFKLVATKFLCWGPKDKERLKNVGYTNVVCIGSPLIKYLSPRIPHSDFKILFVPIIMEKEEPDNLLVYSKLKEWELKNLQTRIYSDYEKMRMAWATQFIEFPDSIEAEKYQNSKSLADIKYNVNIVPTIPYNELYKKSIIAKLTPLHDVEKYACPQLITSQDSKDSLPQICGLLKEIDVIVCMEEGTLPLLATALNIPVIHVDIYKYKSYGGNENYSKVEIIKSLAAYRITNLNELPDVIDYCLIKDKDNKFKEQLRIKVCEEELGPQFGDPVENILNEVESLCGDHSLKIKDQNTQKLMVRGSSGEKERLLI